MFEGAWLPNSQNIAFFFEILGGLEEWRIARIWSQSSRLALRAQPLSLPAPLKSLQCHNTSAVSPAPEFPILFSLSRLRWLRCHRWGCGTSGERNCALPLPYTLPPPIFISIGMLNLAFHVAPWARLPLPWQLCGASAYRSTQIAAVERNCRFQAICIVKSCWPPFFKAISICNLPPWHQFLQTVWLQESSTRSWQPQFRLNLI